ncbi:MAG: rluD [Planctomycetaceae bacterium]|nr:rluD [Planctomycetaceae bacterium]
MAIKHQTHSVESEHAGRIDRIVQLMTQRSRADIRGMFDHDCVFLNAQPCPDAGTLVAAGDQVEVKYDPHTRYKEKPRPPQDRAYRLVYEDDALIVVDKAAHVLTVPTDHGETNTLIDAVSRYLSHQRRQPKAYAVQRLDRGTSGLLVFGKSRPVAEQLQDQFRQRKPDREYVALVAGTVEPASGTFESQMATNQGLQRYSTGNWDEEAEHAITHYRTERLVRGATFVRVRLETGRRNQIRVHFAEAGHPVLGDPRYETKLAQHRNWTAARLALHAAVLGFSQPVTGQLLRFESPLPQEFVKFLGDGKPTA